MSTRKAITLAEKLKLISRYEQINKEKGKANVSTLAAEYGMRVSTLHTIFKNRERIGQEAEEAKSFVGGDRKRLWTSPVNDINKCLPIWLPQKHDFTESRQFED